MIKPMILIILSLVTLIGVGALYNNAAASGLTVNPNFSSCPADSLNPSGIPICTSSASAGCQLSASNCDLSGSSVSFLNQQSPFTPLFSGNIFGFFNSLNANSNGGAIGPFNQNGGGTYYVANCIANPFKNTTATYHGLRHYDFLDCTQATPSDNQNVSNTNAFKVTNWNPNVSGSTTTLPFFHWKSNATASFACFWNLQTNYTSSGPANGYTWYGCDITTPLIANPPDYSVLLSLPNAIGRIGSNGSHVSVFVQPESWETADCAINQQLHFQDIWSQQCLNFITGSNSVTSGGNTFNFGLFTPVVTFIIGIILFVVGLAINVSISGTIFGTGTGFGVGVGNQGARLAQVLGFGLLVWSPIFSEFGNWITAANFPYGINLIVTFFITGMFFFGVFWQILSIAD